MIAPVVTVSPTWAVATHAKLAYWHAHRYHRRFPELEIEDLVQEATIGLVDAATQWRPDGGAAFLTYARMHIFGRLSRWRFLARRRGLTGEGAKDTHQDSIDATAGTDEDGGGELDALVDAPIAEDAAIAAEHAQLFNRAIATLPERQREIIALYREGETLEEIGARYGYSRETIRQTLVKSTATLAKDMARRPARQPTHAA